MRAGAAGPGHRLQVHIALVDEPLADGPQGLAQIAQTRARPDARLQLRRVMADDAFELVNGEQGVVAAAQRAERVAGTGHADVSLRTAQLGGQLCFILRLQPSAWAGDL